MAIDIGKGVGIILVAIGHNWIIGHNSEELFRVIYSFHVPLFFFLSGVLFREDTEFADLIIQKWHSILKPYFVVLFCVSLFVGISRRKFPIDNLIGVFFATGQSILWTPMWFLPNLFITTIFSWGIISIFQVREKLTIAFVVVFILLIIGVWAMSISRSLNLYSLSLDNGRINILIGLPFSIDLLFISGAYFILGSALSDFVKNYKFNMPLVIFSVSIFTSSHYFSNETMNLNYRVYGDLILSTLQAIFGIYLILVASECIKNFKSISVVLSYIGSGSLFILIFHGVVQSNAIILFQKFFPSSGLIGGLFGLLVGIAIPLVIWEVVRGIPIAATLLLPPREKFVKKV